MTPRDNVQEMFSGPPCAATPNKRMDPARVEKVAGVPLPADENSEVQVRHVDHNASSVQGGIFGGSEQVEVKKHFDFNKSSVPGGIFG